jgi:hypothetical protein
MKFKEYLIETITDNQMELLIPSRDYTEEEVVYMRGYQQALQDMLDDFTDEINAVSHDKYAFSLN